MRSEIAIKASRNEARVPVLRHALENYTRLFNRLAGKKTPMPLANVTAMPYVCNVYHIEQATKSANPKAVGLFYGRAASHRVPTPVWSVNAPTACSGDRRRESGALLFYPRSRKGHIV